MSDPQLVRSAQAGVRRAFHTLLLRHQDRIYRLAIRLCRNPADAEEICQETFTRAFRSLGAFHGDSSFVTWLYRIAVNEALMRKRAFCRRPTESTEVVWRHGEEVASDDAGADDLLDWKVRTERVLAALARLDVANRTALVLRDLEELSAEDAARVLGVSPETVRQRAHRARLQLRVDLRDLADPGG